MALLDNKIVQIGLALLVVYLLMGMTKGTRTEGMDTVVNVTPEQTTVSVQGQTIAQVPSGMEEETTYQTTTFTGPKTTVGAGGSPNFAGPSQILPENTQVPEGGGLAAPLTAISEELLATAPAGAGAAAEAPFQVQAVDYDEIFNRNDNLDAADLIPRADPGELYGDLKPDPTGATNFLVNAWQLGIATDAGKRNPINDPRKIYAIPMATVSPWQNPTRDPPDFSRRSYADIE